MHDKGMGVPIAWKMDLTGGYDHLFLKEAASIKGLDFLTLNNPSVWPTLDSLMPDAVLLHGYASLTMLRALVWCRTRGVPAMMISDSSLHVGTGIVARYIKAKLLPGLFSQFSAFLSIGDANQTYLQAFKVPREKIFRVPNVVDEGFWRVRHERQERRSRERLRLNLEDDDVALLFVGKLIQRKRPGDIIEAIAIAQADPRFLRTGKRLRLLLAGGGELAGELEQRARSRAVDARQLGFVNVDELPDVYCASDVLVHPAEIETFGVVVLEAAILGLPLILSGNVGALGPTSIARQDENALVYRSGDVDALAELIVRLCTEPELRTGMSNASLEISVELGPRLSVEGTVQAVRYCTAEGPKASCE